MARRLSAVLMLVVLATGCATPRMMRLDTGQERGRRWSTSPLGGIGPWR